MDQIAPPFVNTDNLSAVECDVVVAGSGSAGLTAAVVAARSGLKVILVEKAALFGGTSAWSGGGCWIPANPLATSIGIEDSTAAGGRYIDSVVGNHLRSDLRDAFLQNSNAMLDFMLKQTEVRFMARKPAPDYHMELPDARIGGRSLASPYYDGRLLGKEMLLKLERPLNAFNAPLGMMMSPLDFMHAMKMFKSWPSFKHMAGVAGRYAVDLFRFGRGSRLTMGNALMARLLRSALDAGVTLWNETPALRLISEDGRVAGLVVRHEGRELALRAKFGVVLATGGFAADPVLRAAHFPKVEGSETMVAAGNTGDGVRMAMANGGLLEGDNAQPASWAVTSFANGANGKKTRCLHFFTDLPKPGNIVVNGRGQRFGNEANLQLAGAMLATGTHSAWIICDHRSVKKYGVGLVWPYAINLKLMERAGYVISAKSLTALAARIGLPAGALEATVANYNKQALEGVDAEFGRGGSPLDRAMGDHDQSPNPCMGPLQAAPYHAVKVAVGDVGSVTGLRVNAGAQVLDGNGAAIPGLYACGLDMNSIWAGTGIANGMNHSHNMTFAYIAARSLATESLANPGSGSTPDGNFKV